MTPFELAEPATVTEALALLDPADPTVRAVGGGTALMLMMKAGMFQPRRLVSLRRIAQLSHVTATPDGGLAIGALTPLADVERAPAVSHAAPVIVRTMRRLSNVRVRNVATIGGCLAHGDPHMDLPPVLMALGAAVTVAGRGGARSIRVEDLFAGYYETVLARDEIITGLAIPPQRARRSAYLKCTTGSADDWPALGVAVSFDTAEGAIIDPVVVVSAATPKATRLAGAEAALTGAPLAGMVADDVVQDAMVGDDTTRDDVAAGALGRAADAAADEAETMADVRGSASYKRELVRVYVRRAVRAALAVYPTPERSH